ncbi:hypothetical protein D910_12556 [Dendroctonus ponderosae]|uniref:Uncharacterized protein n=1 Tax=Dendroctonus ponderosae TaxID=77166 RepID=U4UY81_DENPD|nr:hypothetical protein D910_12556 [Dendroctonus ponderosae]
MSQVSGDEQRRLFGDQKYVREMGEGLNLSLTLTTYGSVAYQLKDANLEASGTCDFVCKALGIVNKTGKTILDEWRYPRAVHGIKESIAFLTIP